MSEQIEILFIENNGVGDAASWSEVFSDVEEMDNAITSWLDFIDLLNEKHEAKSVGSWLWLRHINAPHTIPNAPVIEVQFNSTEDGAE